MYTPAIHHERTTCGGLTKANKPCRIDFGLDEFGYCKYHSPCAPKCRGIARSTGRRCRISLDLDADGYCSNHRLQEPRQCIAFASSTGLRCRRTSGIDEDGRCALHQRVDDAVPICQGTLLNSNKRCSRPSKQGYEYCCAAHDPSFAYISPRMFNSSVMTRAHLEDQVVARYSGRDLYHNDILDMVTPGHVEMDHILEKQCFSYVIHSMQRRDDREEMDSVVAMIRDEVVNEPTNLCFTRKTTNRIKGAAVWRFLDDCTTGHLGRTGAGGTFVDYMLAENQESARLGRQTTRVISCEMGSALKRCQRRFEAEGETPILDALSVELQRLYVTMQLRTSTKP